MSGARTVGARARGTRTRHAHASAARHTNAELPRAARRTALGSARETWGCLDVAEANGYVEAVDAGIRTKLSQVIASLIKVTR